jgi:hypothetical protein
VLYAERVNTYVDYQITLQTKPGDAVFEGTLRYDENEKTLDALVISSFILETIVSPILITVLLVTFNC